MVSVLKYKYVQFKFINNAIQTYCHYIFINNFCGLLFVARGLGEI